VAKRFGETYRWSHSAKGENKMRFIRQVAFDLGLLLGLVTVAAAGTVALTYLLTGRLVSLEMAGEKPEVTLMTPDEVVTLIREQREKAKAQPAEDTGGEGDE
jgi:hypothetical protein